MTTNIPQDIVVFDNVTLVTMEEDQIISDGRIVVRGDTIESLGPRNQVPIPSGAKLMDLEGGYALPGFICKFISHG